MTGMEKASKWFQNLLLGKKEEKDKKRSSSVPIEFAETPKAILPATSKEKRRWSFKKSTATDKSKHRSNSSFDDIYAAQLVKQSIQEQVIEQIRVKAVLPANNEANITALVATTDSKAITGLGKDAAAIKIQSVFRSYLARRALRALRALVKLQALIRGHLVRKQTTAVIRCMHALMTIQVRARVKRLQMAEGVDQPCMKRTIFQAESIQENQPSMAKMNETIQERRRSTSKSKSGPLDHHPQVLEKMDHGFSNFHSARLSISKKENHHETCCSPSALTEMSTVTTNDKQIEEMPFKLTSKSLQNSGSNTSKTKETKLPAAPLSSLQRSENPNTKSFGNGSPLLVPSYMSDTESSKAKTRSQSEPKQRPKWRPRQKSRRSTSMEGVHLVPDILRMHTPSQQRRKEQENQYPWLFKLYQSAKLVKESDIDSTYNSNYTKSLTPFEASTWHLPDLGPNK